jgi:hypothetical protein
VVSKSRGGGAEVSIWIPDSSLAAPGRSRARELSLP